MLVTLENTLTVNLLMPEKVFYRIVKQNGNYKDFLTRYDAEMYYNKVVEYDFFNDFRLFKVIQTLDDFGKIIDTFFEEVNFYE